MTRRTRVLVALPLAILSLSLICAIFPSTVLAQGEETGTYGANFLHIPVGAKVMALPNILAGMQPDGSMMFSNPAILAGVPSQELFFSTANWLDDLSLSAASFVVPIERYEISWSLGTRLLYSGNLQGFDDTGQVVADESFYDVAFTTGLSKRFDEIGVDLGASVTYLREHLPAEDGSGVTFSLGGSYNLRQHRFEAYAANIGGDLSFGGQSYPIDSQYSLGYGYRLARAFGTFDLGTQLTFLQSDARRLSFGAAYLLNNHFTLRTGLHHAFSAPTNASLPITAGLGFRYGNFELDYAFTSQEYFPSSHTFSVVFAFGQNAGDQLSEADMASAEENAAPVMDSSPAKQQTTIPATNENSVQTPVETGKGGELVDTYSVIAGIHSRLESARAEVRALRLLKVPAVAEKHDGKYRVLIGRYDSQKDADKAIDKYRKQGHRFTVVVDKI